MIFISYRISDSLDLVGRLDEGLVREFGRDAVFRDKSRLHGGHDWTQELEHNAKTCKVMLVVIGAKWKTAAFTDGDWEGMPRLMHCEDWVRKEINFALDAGNIVIPVFLNDAAMPSEAWLANCELNRLYKKHGEPLRSTADYSHDLANLIAVMRKACSTLPPKPAGDGAPTPPNGTQGPEEAVRNAQQSYLKNFVGRTNVLLDIKDWVDDNLSQRRCLVLTGQPGSGKSALMAKIADEEGKRGGCLFHMVRQAPSARVFVPALIKQAARMAEFEPRFHQGDLADLRLALIDALEKVKKRCGRAVMVLDALDEMDDEGKQGAFLPDVLPDGVRVIMTCRPDAPLLNTLRTRLVNQLEERTLPAFTRVDFDLFLKKRWAPETLATWQNQTDLGQLFESVKGSFLYLRLCVDYLDECWTQAKATNQPFRVELTDLPSIESLLQQDYKRIRTNPKDTGASEVGDHRTCLLQFLSLALEPLDLKQLTDLMNQHEPTFSLENCRDRVADISQWLLDVGKGRYIPHHKVFADYVQNQVLGHNGKRQIHETFCRWLEQPAVSLTPYSLRHRIRHLLEVDRAADAAALLKSLRYLEAKAKIGLVFDLSAEFRETLLRMPAEHTDVPALQRLAEALRHNIHFIDRHPSTLFQCLWNACWWYDCPAADEHYELSDQAGKPGQPSTLHKLLESWKASKEQESPQFTWCRSLRPPATHLNSAQDVIFGKHGGGVNALALSSTGGLVASGSSDRTVRIWEQSSGAERYCFGGHEHSVQGVAFSPNNQLFASVSGRAGARGILEGRIRIWDRAKLLELPEIRAHLGTITAVGFTLDSQKIVTASFDRTVRIWDVVSGAEVRCFVHPAAVTSLAVCPDGQHILSGCDDHVARLWKINQPEEKINARWQYGARVLIQLEDCFWYPGMVVSPQQGGTITVRLDIGEALNLPAARVRPLNLVAGSRVEGWIQLPQGGDGTFAPGTIVRLEGDKVMLRFDFGYEAATPFGLLRVWLAHTPQAQFAGHQGPVRSVAVSSPGPRVLTGSTDGTIRLWNMDGTQTGCWRGHQQPVACVNFSGDGQRIVSGSLDGTVRVWSIAGQELLCLRGHEAEVHCAIMSRDGRFVVSGSLDQTVRVWNLERAAQTRRLHEHDAHITSIAFSRDGARVASGSSDRTVRIWDTEKGLELQRLSGHQQGIQAVVFSPDGQRIVTGSWDKTIGVWEVATGKLLVRLDGHLAQISCLAYAPDGKRFASGSFDDTVRLWEAGAGAPSDRAAYPCRALKGHEHIILCVAFSPDSRLIASGSNDRTVRIWDAISGKELHRLAGTQSPSGVRKVAFSPDGKHIFGEAHRRQTKFEWWVWEAASGKQLDVIDGQGDFVAFAQNKTTEVICGAFEALIVASSTNKVVAWFPHLGLK